MCGIVYQTAPFLGDRQGTGQLWIRSTPDALRRALFVLVYVHLLTLTLFFVSQVPQEDNGVQYSPMMDDG